MKNQKNLGKLKLMSSKVLNEDELLSFRGGSGYISPDCTTVECTHCLATCSGDVVVNCDVYWPNTSECEANGFQWCIDYCNQGV